MDVTVDVPGSGPTAGSPGGRMGGTAGHDRNEEHEEHDATDPPRDPKDDLWRIAETGLQLAALYFAYKQNEGAQQVAEALALLMQFRRRI